ncbi:large ribosomal subunit protein mL45-like [Ornithodoros turicata]|uniref:large ribosomal subunit protein mL45-like n=1 Tax=Ornithodoros turicata TaxID=34597 RepID=UPI00313A097D
MAAPMRFVVLPALRQSFLQKCVLTQLPSTTCMQVRERKNNKHWNPKFKRERRLKYVKIELPDYEEIRLKDRLTLEEMRSKLKEKGIAPARPWTEKPVFISCSGGLFEPYVPPEGDGKVTMLSKEGALQRMRQLEKKGRTMLAIRKVRGFEDDFDITEFAELAQQIYIDTHKALADMNKDKLHELVTEYCYPDMVYSARLKTIKWQFLKSLEPPRVVHVRTEGMITKENVMAQITLRLHTQQTLAVYDRFGRLMYGSEAMAKDVLEYVVFEKHLANVYGTWRIHAKIIPDWMPPREPVLKTYVQCAEETPQEEEKTTEVAKEAAGAPPPTDALATI